MKYILILIAVVYLAVINTAAFRAMGKDKHAAQTGAPRTPEKTLFRLAQAGGGIGILIGMRHFRHKTKQESFTIGIPVLLLMQLLLVFLIWLRLR